MAYPSSTARRHVGCVLFVTAAMLPSIAVTASTFVSRQPGSTDDMRQARVAVPTVPAPLPFAMPADAKAFLGMSAKARSLPMPDARRVATAFIREHLNVDGGDYVVAHFATAEQRSLGVPDHTASLTDALMEAFPQHSRHSFFAEASDTVGGGFGGGEVSPRIVGLDAQLVHSGDAGSVFANVARFLWSRTGPGYLYNTFFAEDNVVQ